MNDSERIEGARHEAEETLRLLAALPAPENLTDRVHARLQTARLAPAKRGFWSYWLPAQRFQFAGAAALVLAVVGSTWTVYRSHRQVAGRPAVHSAIPAQPSGGFGPAGAVRVPPTLHPIPVPARPKAAAHRKPGAGRATMPSAPKPLVVAAPPAANP